MKILFIGMIVFSLLIVPALASAKSAPAKEKTESKIDIMGSFTGSEGSKNLISVVLLLTILAFAPAILLLMSSFTRIVIVLSFLRQAIGIAQIPPNQIIIGLSLFLTFFIMAPTYEKVHTTALAPYMSNKIGYEEFISKSSQEMSAFMLKFTKEKDLALFINLAGIAKPKNESEIPLCVIVPAFVII